MNKRIIFCLLIILCLVDCTKKGTPIDEIDIAMTVNVSTLVPSFNIRSSLVKSANVFSVDLDNNLYFLDDANHRILKYDSIGHFLCQIGGIGQGNNDLIFPCGLFIWDGSVYVLDDFGHALKSFTLEGKYQDKVKIDNESECTSFIISREFYIFNLLSKEYSCPNTSLFIMLSKDLRCRREIGKTNKTNSALAFSVFNKAFLSYNGTSVFGAYQSYPAMFRYNKEGREIYFKDLREIKEISMLEKWGIQKNVDNPSNAKSNKKVTALIFCDGFGIDNKSFSYYAININRASKGIILVFDENGKIVRKIIPKYRNKNVRIERILVQGDDYYALINHEKEVYLTNIKLQRR